MSDNSDSNDSLPDITHYPAEAIAQGTELAQKLAMHLASKYTNSLLEDLLIMDESFCELIWDIIVDGLQSRASEEQLVRQLSRREYNKFSSEIASTEGKAGK